MLRELNIHGLPPAHEVAAVKTVTQFIGLQLTNVRSLMKDKVIHSHLLDLYKLITFQIKSSMEVGADGSLTSNANIAHLTFALAHGTNLNVTLRHYVRVAVLVGIVITSLMPFSSHLTALGNQGTQGRSRHQLLASDR